ncbi:GNAT family N-acetyltransferase [Streptomyces griseofuscus]|uniref:GNAT family N-acetyltransferase n=1 Tax=Streptomyces griseofuscus TaxID=146922 RepID=A0A3R8QC74_9ACTN|nr:GNAT family N-acetyltransferase [Streptomyces griseofuscus]RRQ86112.1 GNAT family N-acetyltransferase [Streptomyces griseofuscus]
MRADDWHLTHDVDGFLDRTGTFLHARPVRHIVTLSMFQKLREREADAGGTQTAATTGTRVPVFGWVERAGEVDGTFYHLPSGGIGLTPLSPARADALADRLANLGCSLPYVSADRDTAAAFSKAWKRYAGVGAAVRVRLCLYRLGELTPPRPVPAGRGRSVGEHSGDRGQLMDWCREFAADVEEDVIIDAGTWAGTRFARKRYTFWESSDGVPVSMAGVNPMLAGVAQVDPVYTPARFRGRGYAGAVTVEVSRAALAAGAESVVLFTNAANATSNALYQRLGYVRVTDWAVYDFTQPRPQT